jgi:hypothetical protein
MEGVTHSPFSVLHSKIGITTIFDGCSIPHDAKPRPHEKELMHGGRSSCEEERAHDRAHAGKKELARKRSSWKNSCGEEGAHGRARTNDVSQQWTTAAELARGRNYAGKTRALLASARKLRGGQHNSIYFWCLDVREIELRAEELYFYVATEP